MASNVRLSRLSKELADLEQDPRPGIICHPVDDDDITHLEAFIKGPPDSPYEKGNFKLDIKVPDDYPFSPPQMRFLTRVYHPNIDDGGRICADILKKGEHGSWRPSLNISTTLISLSGLLASPNPDDPLDAEIAREYQLDNALFLSKAKEYTLKYATGKQANEDSTVQRSEVKQNPDTDALATDSGSSSSSSSSGMAKSTDRPTLRKSKLSLSTKKRKSALSLTSPSSSLPVLDTAKSTQSSQQQPLSSSNNNSTTNTQSDISSTQHALKVVKSNNESFETNSVDLQSRQESQLSPPISPPQQLSQNSSRDANTPQLSLAFEHENDNHSVDELSQDYSQHSVNLPEQSSQQEPLILREDIDDETTSQDEVLDTLVYSSSKSSSQHSAQKENSQRSSKSDKSSKSSRNSTSSPRKENVVICLEDDGNEDESQNVERKQGSVAIDKDDVTLYTKNVPSSTSSSASTTTTTTTTKKPLQEVSQSSQNMVESPTSMEDMKSMSSPCSSSSGRISFRELFKSTDDEKYMPKKRKIPASMRDKLSLSKTKKRQKP